MVKFVEGTHNGFCSGVQSAVNAVERKARELGRVYTYGPIIHNRTVVEAVSYTHLAGSHPGPACHGHQRRGEYQSPGAGIGHRCG